MWNYRIIKSNDGNYGLYEVIYNEDGEISAHSEESELTSPSVKDLLDSLRLMLDDAQKSSYDILEMDKIKFAPLVDEDEEFIEVEDWSEFMGLKPKKYKK
tara:strand:+ start:20 stop:319 length:300 start_codon:yes stop_codon:yes gene_type:complete